ncbi:putative nuclease HARBI1 [Ornithodoros turicata]|uniref:putative nuclease HARBI1 n=1 Tax=Ornithodoros turicata TaxID=34597 RepID=UPI00313895AC
MGDSDRVKMEAGVITALISRASDLFYRDDDNDDWECIVSCLQEPPCPVGHRGVTARVVQYAETTVPTQTPQVFQSNFRLQKSSFEQMVLLLAPILTPDALVGRPPIVPEKQLMLFVWYLANMEGFRSVGDRFGITRSSVFRRAKRVGTALISRARTFIKWPTQEEALQSMMRFEGKAGFPKVIGAIDGSYIPIKAPPETLNHMLKFLHCSAGEPGSLQDAGVFRRSDFARNINADMFPYNSHILGDAAYPLKGRRSTAASVHFAGALPPSQESDNLGEEAPEAAS